jgi:hypothetical protein
MRRSEVFPLEACVRKFLLHRLYEPIDEVEVILADDAFMAPAEVLRIAEPLGVVCAYIEHDRQSPCRMDATYERVQGKLSDRYPCRTSMRCDRADLRHSRWLEDLVSKVIGGRESDYARHIERLQAGGETVATAALGPKAAAALTPLMALGQSRNR